MCLNGNWFSIQSNIRMIFTYRIRTNVCLITAQTIKKLMQVKKIADFDSFNGLMWQMQEPLLDQFYTRLRRVRCTKNGICYSGQRQNSVSGASSWSSDGYRGSHFAYVNNKMFQMDRNWQKQFKHTAIVICTLDEAAENIDATTKSSGTFLQCVLLLVDFKLGLDFLR